MSPSPDDFALPWANSDWPALVNSDDVPLISVVTNGTNTPTSSLSVTPILADATTVLVVISRLVVPVRVAADVHATLRTCMPSRCSLFRRSYVADPELTPTLALPSPRVIAGSANDGPNVAAVRT